MGWTGTRGRRADLGEGDVDGQIGAIIDDARERGVDGDDAERGDGLGGSLEETVEGGVRWSA